MGAIDPRAGPVYLTFLGVVEEEDVNLAGIAVWHAFGLPVARWPGMAADPAAHDPARKQWNSSLLLRQVSIACPADAFRILALTAYDIFIPMLSFVFGQAQLGGRAAMVSTARLRQEFHGLPENRALFSGRLVKEVIHELGHSFGLVHCPDPACSMSLSTTLRQVDQKGSELCRKCLFNLRALMVRRCGADGGSSS